MAKIFVGFLFIFLDFSLNLEANTIGLIPDFVGGILLCLAMKELKKESTYFDKNFIATLIYTIIATMFYMTDFMGLFINDDIINWIIDLGITALMIYVTYNVVKGIMDMQNKYVVNLEAQSMYNYWLVLAILQVVGSVVGIIPFLATPLPIVVSIADFVMIILFLVKLHTAKKNFEHFKMENRQM